MMDREPLTSQQLKVLPFIQWYDNIPVHLIQHIMVKQGILLGVDADNFSHQIVQSGNIAFTRLRYLIAQFDIFAPELKTCQEYYRWVWVCYKTSQILCISRRQFTNYDSCFKKGNAKRPKHVIATVSVASYINSIPHITCY